MTERSSEVPPSPKEIAAIVAAVEEFLESESHVEIPAPKMAPLSSWKIVSWQTPKETNFKLIHTWKHL